MTAEIAAARVAKLSVCDCLFASFGDGTEIGSRYSIYPRTARKVYVRCGGCGKTARRMVVAVGHPDSRSTFMLLELFEFDDPAMKTLAEQTASNLPPGFAEVDYRLAAEEDREAHRWLYEATRDPRVGVAIWGMAMAIAVDHQEWSFWQVLRETMGTWNIAAERILEHLEQADAGASLEHIIAEMHRSAKGKTDA